MATSMKILGQPGNLSRVVAPESNIAPTVTKTKAKVKKTPDIWGKHASEPEQTSNDGTWGGSSWHSPADQETVNTIRGQQNA